MAKGKQDDKVLEKLKKISMIIHEESRNEK
ncbi:MAG: hypothetical protein CM15mV2_1920 [uncultured marine virus]|nr:MAG: hypothetical protein CM15mV2_1920 [uncultured marine virus]